MRSPTGASLAIPLCLMLLASCSRQTQTTDLPHSDGPFESTLPPATARTLAERGGQLVIPSQTSTAQALLSIAVRPDTQWGPLAEAIRKSSNGSENYISVLVRDSRGSKRSIHIPVASRFTGPIYYESPGASLIADDDVLVLRQPGSGVAIIEHSGALVSIANVRATLIDVFHRSGSFFFRPNEQPSQDDFPVWIQPEASVRFQEVVDAVSAAQSAGFPTVLLDVGGR
jgi:hypothetical protein